MFKFSLKNLYDDKVAVYLFWLDLCKWGSLLIVILGVGLVYWFDGWLALVGGGFLVIIGLAFALLAYFAKKKISIFIKKGGELVELSEGYLITQIKQKLKK